MTTKHIYLFSLQDTEFKKSVLPSVISEKNKHDSGIRISISKNSFRKPLNILSEKSTTVMNKLMQNYQKGLRLEFIHSCEHKFQNNFEVREIFMNDLANEY